MSRKLAPLAILFVVGTALAAAPPMPPIKPGLWEVRTVELDADGKPKPPPEQAAMANMPPELRARMAEMMKARGMPMMDESGAIKMCQSKESMDSGKWQAISAQAGCTADYTLTSPRSWKFHSSCPKLNAQSDGEVEFTDAENYTTKVTSTAKVLGKTSTTTRVMKAHFLGANCGDIKPFTADSLKAP